MRRALWTVAGLVALGAAGWGARVAWLHRPAGVFALPAREAPAPECDFVVQLDRASNAGQLVQFGDVRCPGDDEEAALRVGARWFRLPATSTGSRYGMVRRSVDHRAWVVASEADFFRSDDGGETFFLLHLPGWGETDVIHEPAISGDALEQIAFEQTKAMTRLDRLKAALDHPAPTSVRERWDLLVSAWDETHWAVNGMRFESDDGGRTWTKHGP